MRDCSVSIRAGSARAREGKQTNGLQLIYRSDFLFSNPPPCSLSAPCTPHSASVKPTRVQTAHSSLNAEPTSTSTKSLLKATPSVLPFSVYHCEMVVESPSAKASEAVPAATRRTFLRRGVVPVDLRRGKMRAARRTRVEPRSMMQSRRAVGKSGKEKGSCEAVVEGTEEVV